MAELTMRHLMAVSGEPKMEMGPIHKALGETGLQLDPTPLGRYRLLSALRNKYGPSFRNNTQAQSALRHFDGEFQHYSKIRQIKGGIL